MTTDDHDTRTDLILAERELGTYLRQATRSLFRLETLSAYDVPTDRGDFPRYLAVAEAEALLTEPSPR